ncbi:MAG: hypothetical protein HYY17_15590 [Planctomycetes bacterium]|nr:hypothetical protein [Planctomycetota bacterium]
MKLWTGWVALALMTGGAWAQDDAAADLGKAGAKAQEWKSYSFKTASKSEGMPQRGGGGGGQENAGPRTTEGEYVADKGLHSKTGENEVIRKGEKTAVKGRDGKWAAPETGGGGGRGRRGMGGFPPPHESLKEIEKSFKSVAKGSDGDATVYSGDLTADGVTKLSGGRGFGGRGGRQGGGTLESSGTAKVWVDADGNITKIEVKTQVKGKIQEREFDIKTERTVEFSKIGSTDFEIPEEAKAILEK